MKTMIAMKTMIGDDLKTCVMNLDLATDMEFRVEIDMGHELDQIKWVGTIDVQFKNYTRRMNIRFDNQDDAVEFQKSLLQFFREGAVPIETEDEQQYRFWFEFEATSIKYISEQ